MKIAIKRYGEGNLLGLPSQYPQERLELRDDENIPLGYEEVTEQQYNDIVNLYINQVTTILNDYEEQNRLNTTFRFSNTTSVDDTVPYNTRNYIKKEVQLEGESTMVIEFYESYNKNTNEFVNLVVREEKEYVKVGSTLLYNKEIMRVKYYSLNNQVIHIKVIETPLALGYQMSVSTRLQELKIIKAEEYLFSIYGNAIFPLHTELLEEIKQYERMSINALYVALTDSINAPISQNAKDIIATINIADLNTAIDILF